MKRGSLYIGLFAAGLLAGGYLVNNFLHGQAGPEPRGTGIPKELSSYREVVKKVLPAVVSVEARTKPVAAKIKRLPAPVPEDPRLPEEFRRFFDRIPDLPDMPRPGFGSGFLVDAKGVVVTNF